MKSRNAIFAASAPESLPASGTSRFSTRRASGHACLINTPLIPELGVFKAASKTRFSEITPKIICLS